jgi:hypothetical protein
MSCYSSTIEIVAPELTPDIDPLGLAKLIGGKLALRWPSDNYADLQVPTIQRENINPMHLTGTLITHTRSKGYDGSGVLSLMFLADNRLERFISNPWKYVPWVMQLSCVASPDFSVFPEKPPADQFMAVYANRLVGAVWQKAHVHVLPTVSWGDENSFSYCFKGIERNSTVIVSTFGTVKLGRRRFMSGFEEMCHILQPIIIICYNNPYY